jgi:hypothetical protein
LQEGIDYQTNSQVQTIQTMCKGGRKVSRLTMNEQVHDFDVVIVAGRPHQVSEILPTNHPMTPLYSQIAKVHQQLNEKVGVYGVAIVEASWNTTHIFGSHDSSEFYVDYMVHMNDMFDDKVQPNQVSLMRTIIQKESEKLFTTTWYVPRELVNTEEEKNQLKELLMDIGLLDPKIIKMNHYDQITRASPSLIADHWYQKAAKAQGIDGLYFVGEIFSGHGVPTTFLHTQKWVLHTFGLEAYSMQQKFRPKESTVVGGDISLNSSLIDLASMVLEALTMNPVDAVKLGLHPSLLVQSTVETAVPHSFSYFILLLSTLSLQLFHWIFKKSSFRKNIAIYCTEFLFSCVLATILLVYGWDIALFLIPKDILTATRLNFGAVTAIHILYASELLFNQSNENSLGMRPSLRAHHIASIVIYIFGMESYMASKSLYLLRINYFMCLSSQLEQNVFFVMFLHRTAPKVLQTSPKIVLFSSCIYLTSRILFSLPLWYTWYQFSRNKRNQNAITLAFQFVYPFLLAIQMCTQWLCFKVQYGLYKRYKDQRKKL